MDLPELAKETYERTGLWEEVIKTVHAHTQAYIDMTDVECMDKMFELKKEKKYPTTPRFRDFCESKIKLKGYCDTSVNYWIARTRTLEDQYTKLYALYEEKKIL